MRTRSPELAFSLKFPDIVSLKGRCDRYFEETLALGKPITVSGLCSFIGISREHFLEYPEHKKFGKTILEAKLKIQEYAEEQLFINPKSVSGAMFTLKNNFGWKDKDKKSEKKSPVVKLEHYGS